MLPQVVGALVDCSVRCVQVKLDRLNRVQENAGISAVSVTTCGYLC